VKASPSVVTDPPAASNPGTRSRAVILIVDDEPLGLKGLESALAGERSGGAGAGRRACA
jgi:hypothetical protein